MSVSVYIIRAIASGGFWTGKHWSDEYPDAELFERAKETAKKAARVAFCSSQAGVEVIADYGLDTERVVLTVRK